MDGGHGPGNERIVFERSPNLYRSSCCQQTCGPRVVVGASKYFWGTAGGKRANISKKWKPEHIVCASPDSQEDSYLLAPSADIWDRLGTWSSNAARYFTVWVIVASVMGFLFPPCLSWFNKDCVTAALAITMVGMGLTLKTEDFAAVADKPGQVLVGVALQYTIMPTLGVLISKYLGVPATVATGAKNILE